jgi:hypothetical protein
MEFKILRRRPDYSTEKYLTGVKNIRRRPDYSWGKDRTAVK